MQRNLIRLPVPESNFSVSKLTMAGSNDTTVGDLNEQANDTQTPPALESELRECLKRYDERLHDQNERDVRLMSELSSIKRTLQTQPHLTEEGKKARIAPRKLRSCVLMCLSHIVDDADRRISQYLRCSAVFRASRLLLRFEWPSVPCDICLTEQYGGHTCPSILRRYTVAKRRCHLSSK